MYLIYTPKLDNVALNLNPEWSPIYENKLVCVLAVG